jgi:hypothetical protein
MRWFVLVVVVLALVVVGGLYAAGPKYQPAYRYRGGGEKR